MTVLFADIVGFTAICDRIDPLEVVTLLNQMYDAFDDAIDKHNCFKVAVLLVCTLGICMLQVETIGDAYMIVSGCPTKTDYHAGRASGKGAKESASLQSTPAIVHSSSSTLHNRSLSPRLVKV